MQQHVRRLGRLGLMLLLPACSSAYATFAADSAELDNRDAGADLRGFAIGVEAWETGAKAIGFAEARSWNDANVGIDVLELNFGGRLPLLETEQLLVGLQADIGAVHADVDGFRNRNTLVGLGAGAFGRFRIIDQLWLHGSLGVRGYWDTTDPTTCRDGTTSTSTGQGTCSYHGGIAHYNDQLGDAFSTEVMLGFVFRF